jgi:FHS family glucose/mannose:H+ symporter-like MFS transporter
VTSPPLSQPKLASPSLAFWIHAQFILVGVTTVLLGPLLPAIAEHWSMRDLQSGYFFPAQFSGNMLGSLLSTRLLPRWGFARLCAVAMAILFSGLAILALGSRQIGLAGIFLNGLGMGLAIAASNLWAAESNPERRASALSLLNFSWGIGAVACPLLIGTGLHFLPLTRLLPALAAIPLFFAFRFATLPTLPAQSIMTDSIEELPETLWRPAAFGILAVLSFLYVGTETALGGWIASYAEAFGKVSMGAAAMAPSAFWAGLLFGRGVAPQVLRRYREHPIFVLGLLTALVATAIVLTTHVIAFLLISTALAGLGLAAIYPILLAVMSRELGAQSKRLGGFFFACGGMGAAFIPFAVGAISSHAGSRRVGLTFVLATITTLLLLSLGLSKRLPFSAQEPV